MRKKKGILCVTYTESYSGGGICIGQEDDPYPSYEDKYVDWCVTGVCTEEMVVTPYYYEVVWKGEVPDELYVVYVRYRDGDSFGRAHGLGRVEALCSTEVSAREAVDAIRGDSRWTSPHGYNVWAGYFADLEDAAYEKFEVTKHSSPTGEL